MNHIRTRYPPSPTGMLHVGGARTALFNYLFAKKYGGRFILRIEDTDLERSDPQYEKDIFTGLRWLGLAADESSEVGGPFGPYKQSERIGFYRRSLEKLFQEGKVFYCFHSEGELEKERNKLLEIKRPPLHLCEYRNMDREEAEILKDAKPDYVVRFKTPLGKKIAFQDLLRGEISFDSNLLGDFPIAKRLDAPLYNFAVVVDDAEMKISHVIRGEDHISNTPKQLLLIEALGFNAPQYLHLPLILAEDRSKLSKRHGATSLADYREAGYLPEALFNFLALLGWNPGNDKEVFSREELIKEFSTEKLQKSGAVFDIDKLDWMNGHYIRQKSVAELTNLCLPYLKKDGLAEIKSSKLKIKNYNSKFKSDQEYLERIIGLEQPRLKKLSEIGERVKYFFRQPEYDRDLLRWKNMDTKEILDSLECVEKVISNFQNSPPRRTHGLRPSKVKTFTFDSISKEDIERAFLKEIGTGDKGRILWPLRVALTGKKASPGPFEIMEILGSEETLRRIKTAKEILQGSIS